MKRSPWFPVWAAYQFDPSFLSVSVEAEALYFRAVGRCRLEGEQSPGLVYASQLDSLCDRMHAPALELVGQLCAAYPEPLWAEAGDYVWRICAYRDWISGTDSQRTARTRRALIANHKRWGHEGDVEECPKCAGVPTESGSESVEIPREDKRREDKTTPRSRTPTDGPEPDEPHAEAAAVQLADQLLEALGFPPGSTANAGEVAYTRRAITQGHTPDDLKAQAAIIGARDDIRDHRLYLVGYLRRCANEPPTKTTAPPPRRPLLDDERAPCEACGQSGWIDAPEGGGVVRCPCTRQPEVAQ